MSLEKTPLRIHFQTHHIPVDEINLNDWNPNFVPTDILDAIRDDIIQNGFIGHIVVQKHNERMNKDNVIINGEHRFNIFKELGGIEVPAIRLDVDDNRAKSLTIRLNREHGELLPNKIGDVLREISPEKNLELLSQLTHINHSDLLVLLDIGTGLEGVFTKPKEKYIADMVTMGEDDKVTCPKCSHRFGIVNL